MYKTKDGLWRHKIVINGKAKTFSAKNKKDLMLKIALYKDKHEGLRINQLADEWIEDVEKRVVYNTMKGYRSAYQKILQDWEDTPVEDITPQKVLAWLKRYDHMAQKTITNLLLVLRQIIDYGCIHYGLQYNPCDKVKPPKGTGKKIREFPSEKDIDIVNSNIDLPYGLFLYTILYTGMRRGEICALRWKDIDFKNQRIHVRQSSFWTNDHERHDKSPKSQAGERDVPLLPSLADKLKAIKGDPDELVFGDLKEYQIDKGVRKYMNETGLSCTPHGLRHGFASILFKQGLDVKTIQYVMGHAQTSTTMEIYVHLMEEDKTASALEALKNYQVRI